MSKRFLAAVGALAVGGLLAWALVRWYIQHQVVLPAATQEEMAILSRRIHKGELMEPPAQPMTPVPPSHRVRLAIGGLGLSEVGEDQELADLLTAQLASVKGLELVDRATLDRALQEMASSLSGLSRPRDAIQVGALVKADWFLLGSALRSTNRAPGLVARMVDARTGIMRNVALFVPATNTIELATHLASFVRRCREADPKAESRSFLAIGSFGDVGVNSRQSGFPFQLSAYLTSAYRRSQLTLLERDDVRSMLEEIQLDLAGLTQESTTPPPPLQSAFWIVDGFFQSLETTNHQVELVLRITRAFGRSSFVTLLGEPEAVCQKVRQTIDQTLANAPPRVPAPTRRSELQQQIATARELFSQATDGLDPMLMMPKGYTLFGTRPQFYPKRRRTLQEAIRSLQTALVLDHENAEAKFYLAACYADQTIDDLPAARAYLRELAESTPESNWSRAARQGLTYSFIWENDNRQAQQWFEQAALHAKDQPATDFYRAKAREFLIRAIAQEGAASVSGPVKPEERSTLEQETLDCVRQEQGVLQGHSGGLDDSCGLRRFVSAYGNNHAGAAQALTEMLPKLKREFPDFTPHLLASILTYQSDTNNPMFGDFLDSLRTSREHPEKLLGAGWYFETLLRGPYNWAMEHGHYGLALEITEAKRSAALLASARPGASETNARDAAAQFSQVHFDAQDQVKLAFAYMKLERWAEALRVLNDLGDKPLRIIEDGPWGHLGLAPFLPGRAADECRNKLGMAAVRNPNRFEIGSPCLRLVAFVAGEDCLWAALPGELLQLDFDLRTNRQISLPEIVGAPVQDLLAADNAVWVATAGAGLLRVDKATGACRALAETNGLLLDYVTSLCSDAHHLWLGFGHEGVGGLGRLDWSSGQITSFTPNLVREAPSAHSFDPPTEPPRHSVTQLAFAGNRAWMLVDGKAPRSYEPDRDKWEGLSVPQGDFNCFAVDETRLAVALLRRQKVVLLLADAPTAGVEQAVSRVPVTAEELNRLKSDPVTARRIQKVTEDAIPTLEVYNFRDTQTQAITLADSLPASPTFLALHGSDAYLAGPGYLAIFDLDKKNLRKLCYFSASGVRRLAFAGGYAWLQLGHSLYRVPLT